eukprot:30087-Pelagococcus_subviridis.AAC.37
MLSRGITTSPGRCSRCDWVTDGDASEMKLLGIRICYFFLGDVLPETSSRRSSSLSSQGISGCVSCGYPVERATQASTPCKLCDYKPCKVRSISSPRRRDRLTLFLTTCRSENGVVALPARNQ